MADTTTLTDHEAIRDWAAARAGRPAIADPAPGQPESAAVLRIVFGQQAYQDQDQGTDPAFGLRLVEWDEWFALFDERGLALVVSQDVPGQRDSFHEIVRR